MVKRTPKLTNDPHNANRGTARGREMVNQSLQEYGAGRSILIDKHGVAIAGNKTLEAAQALGIPVKVIESNGQELYAIQRTDLDLATDDQAIMLGIADNRASEVGLEWNPDILQSLADNNANLDQFWSIVELANIWETEPSDPYAEWQEMPEFVHDSQLPIKRIMVSFRTEQDIERFARLIGQNVTMSTKSVWYPAMDRERPADYEYVLNGDAE